MIEISPILEEISRTHKLLERKMIGGCVLPSLWAEPPYIDSRVFWSNIAETFNFHGQRLNEAMNRYGNDNQLPIDIKMEFGYKIKHFIVDLSKILQEISDFIKLGAINITKSNGLEFEELVNESEKICDEITLDSSLETAVENISAITRMIEKFNFFIEKMDSLSLEEDYYVFCHTVASFLRETKGLPPLSIVNLISDILAKFKQNSSNDAINFAIDYLRLNGDERRMLLKKTQGKLHIFNNE